MRSSFASSSLQLRRQLADLEPALELEPPPLVVRGQPGELQLGQPRLAVVELVLDGVFLLQVLEIIEVSELADQSEGGAIRRRLSRRSRDLPASSR